jgi:hypothetical protein
MTRSGAGRRATAGPAARWEADAGARKLLGYDLDGPRERGARAELGQKPKREEIFFSFSFPIFQSHFPKDFEFSFEFESNHSIQKFKCSSMNA